MTSSPADGQGQVILQTMPAQMVASGTQSPGQPQVRNSTKWGNYRAYVGENRSVRFGLICVWPIITLK